MDAGDTARRILSLPEGSPADEKQQLLKNAMELIQSEPKVAPTPSLSAAGDYLRIFRHLLRSAFFRTADVRSRHGIMGSALGPLRGNGYSRKSRATRPRIPGFIALACPRFCLAPVMQSWNGPGVITHFISHLALLRSLPLLLRRFPLFACNYKTGALCRRPLARISLLNTKMQPIGTVMMTLDVRLGSG